MALERIGVTVERFAVRVNQDELIDPDERGYAPQVGGGYCYLGQAAGRSV